MAKTTSSSSVKSRTMTSSKVAEPQDLLSFVPERFRSSAYCGVLALLLIIFFRGVLFNAGYFVASDVVSPTSFIPYLEQANRAGEFPQWLPYIFGGMPGYAALLTTGDRWWDFFSLGVWQVAKLTGALLSSEAMRIITFYIVYAVGMFLFARAKQMRRDIALMTAIGAVFSTFVITWVMIGHNTKPLALMTFPYIFLCLEKLRERFSLLYTALLIVVVHVLIESTHVQMVFYGICAFGLYAVVELIHTLVKKTAMQGILRAMMILAFAGGLSFAMAADRYLSVMEYTPYSTRGTAPIEKTTAMKQDANGGFDYEYATNWSFSPQEMITFVVPNFYGFGKLEYKGELTQGRAITEMFYWGQMPFTDAANYMGIIILCFAVYGVWQRRSDAFVQFLAVLSVFSLLLSFGKNFSVLYDLFFYYIPSFNKFRAPSIALVLIQFAVPMLAGFGVMELLSAYRDEARRTATDRTFVRYAAIVGGLFLLLGVVFPAFGKESYMAAMKASANGSRYPAELQTWLYDTMMSDWYATAALLVLVLLCAGLYLRRVLSETMFVAALLVFVVIDMWRVSARPLEISKQSVKDLYFRKTDTIEFLQKAQEQEQTPFRIAHFGNLPANAPAYFGLQTIQGYHSAKMRIYQDLMDVAGAPQGEEGNGSSITNPFLWNLLNVRYIITGQELGTKPAFQSQVQKEYVYENTERLPRAWFVNSVQYAEQMAILKHIKAGDFNPRTDAFVEDREIAQRVFTPSASTASVAVTMYKNERIALNAETTHEQFLVLSEVYYPAWKALIDGQEVRVYKTNFFQRGIVVPAGKHNIEFVFTAPKFEMGKTISLATNVMTLLLLVAGIYVEQTRTKKSEQSHASTENTSSHDSV